jgi:hypothetical protein
VESNDDARFEYAVKMSLGIIGEELKAVFVGQRSHPDIVELLNQPLFSMDIRKTIRTRHKTFHDIITSVKIISHRRLKETLDDLHVWSHTLLALFIILSYDEISFEADLKRLLKYRVGEFSAMEMLHIRAEAYYTLKRYDLLEVLFSENGEKITENIRKNSDSDVDFSISIYFLYVNSLAAPSLLRVVHSEVHAEIEKLLEILPKDQVEARAALEREKLFLVNVKEVELSRLQSLVDSTKPCSLIHIADRYLELERLENALELLNQLDPSKLDLPIMISTKFLPSIIDIWFVLPQAMILHPSLLRSCIGCASMSIYDSVSRICKTMRRIGNCIVEMIIWALCFTSATC